MSAKQIKFWDDSRRTIYTGINKVANAVRVTMWPKGRNVVLGKSYGAPIVTNDGVTVAKEIELADAYENIGASLVKEAANKTNDAAGDGTTTTTVLVDAIANEGMRYIRSGVNPFALGRGIHKAVDLVVNELKSASKPVSTDQEIQQIATISAQDSDVGQLISEVISEVGKDGVVTVEEWKSMGLTKTIVKGMQFDQGYGSPYFVTDPARMEAVIESPAVLVTDKKISTIKDILPLLEGMAAKGKRDIVIIADDVDGEALTTLVLNKLRWMLNVVPVKAPWFGDRKKDNLKDIAVVTGATVITDEVGISWDKADVSMFGSADRVIITKDKTTIVWGKGNPSDIEARADQIRMMMPNITSTYDKEKAQERLARLVGWVAVIKVGAATEMEMKNRKYKIEDALNATRAAVEEGIVAWGGTAFVKIAAKLANTKLDDKDEQTWLDIVLSAIQHPVKQIADNAWYKGDWVVEEVKKSSDFNSWFNAATGQFVNLVDSGIIDPSKVLRVALQHASSAAAMFLTTDAAIVDLPKKDEPALPADGWMGGMWGMGWMGGMWF